ncbi:hypothetical protein J3R83DRAFT_12281 [Lanmaoa asiatica]|nr:hypothetical protein J3R83DRAFT_12281 [Lanmaoa asiatica]
MSSLRATAARTRTTYKPVTLSSFRRSITTRANDSKVFSSLIPAYLLTNPRVSTKSDREKRPHAPSRWSEDLATASEAFVKADRDTTTIEEMQQKTVDHVQSHDPDSEVEQTPYATHARDEVGGPLGAAGMGEFEGVVGNDDLGPDNVQVESNGRVVTRRVMHEKTTVHKGEGQANVSRDHARRQ